MSSVSADQAPLAMSYSSLVEAVNLLLPLLQPVAPGPQLQPQRVSAHFSTWVAEQGVAEVVVVSQG